MNIKAIAAVGLVAVGVVAAGASIVGLGSQSSTSATYRTSTATTTNVEQTAAASGNLVAAKIAKLAFGAEPVISDGTASSSTSGNGSSAASSSSSSSSSSSQASAGSGSAVTVTWPVTAVNVAVGDKVKTGDVLGTADTTTAQLAVRAAEANLAAAKTQRRIDAKGGTLAARASAKDQVKSAQRQLSQARSSYSNTVAQNNLKLTQARRAVTTAKNQYSKDKKAGAPSSVLQADKAAITQAEQSLASTRLQVAGSNTQAAAQVTGAKASLATANRNYKNGTSSADNATLVADDVAIAQAEAALADAQAALDAATLVAPIDGRVTAVNAVVGEDSTGTAFEIQSDQMALAVDVTEDDILSIKVGQPATVTISATGNTVNGTVTSIDPVAATSGSSSVVSYAVVVTLDPASAASASTGSGATTTAATSPAPSASTGTSTEPLPGMSADLTIVIAAADNVTAVPAIALSGTAGNYTVRVLNSDGSVDDRSVQVGLIASDYAQITSGINPGETVITGTSSSRTGTSSSSSSGGREFGPGFGGISGAGGFPQGGGQFRVQDGGQP